MSNLKPLFSPDVPVLLVGAVGIGKTEKVKQAFDYVEILLLSTCQAEDIGGIPYREDTHDYRTIPSIFRRLHEADKEGKTTALFLDELDKAQREVADTLLTLVANRKVGQAILPEKTCIIAAANPPEYGGGDGISVPMLNRFSVIEQEIELREWVEWMQKQFSDPFYQQAILAFETEKLPLFEIAGEGLNQKITSPRSIYLAFKAIQRLKDKALPIIEGLLTPNVSNKLWNEFQFQHEYTEILEKVKKIPLKELRITKTKKKSSLKRPIEL